EDPVGLLSEGYFPTVVKLATPQAKTVIGTTLQIELDTSDTDDDDVQYYHRRSSRRAETLRSQTLETAMTPVGSATCGSLHVDMAIQAWGDELSIAPEELSIVELLGHGSTAMVYEGQWRGRDVAVKRLNAQRTMVPIFVR
ncbi:unnamed protein product, partial [Prorocentrum cordatum]